MVRLPTVRTVAGCPPSVGRTLGVAAALLLALVVGVPNAGGRALAVSTVTIQVIGKGTVTSSPAGADCGNGSKACFIAFSGSGIATLTATAASGWSFDGWTNCPSVPVENTCGVPVDGTDSEVTANFSGPPTTTSTLTVTTTGAGNVRGGSIDCGSEPAGSDCVWTTLTGSTVTIREAPGSGAVFTGWGGACSGTSVACTVELSADRTVSATWTSSTGVLLTVSVSGSGTVTGGGINCPPSCTATQAVNSTVVLTSTPAEGFVFTRWEGACSGTTSTCAVLMDAAKSVTATFAPVVQLTVTVTGNGNVTGENGSINCGENANVCSASFVLNDTVSLTASPGTGATFAGWSGACGGTSTTCTILMSTSRSVIATFSTGPTLTVSVSGNGNVRGGGINCGGGATTCTASQALNSSVTLTASPLSGATFTGWGGACSGTTSTCTLSMTSARSVTATFTTGTGTTVPLTVTVGGPGTVTGGGISCGNGATVCTANPTLNASVTLTATPASGATFTGWGGACSGATSTCTISMNAAKSVSATFGGPAAGTLTIAVSGRGTVRTSAGTCVGSGPRKTCVQLFAAGRRVVLTATPASGATFVGWSGACTGTRRTCTVNLNTAKRVNATFSGPAVNSVPVGDLRAAGDRLVVSEVVFSPNPVTSRTEPIRVRVRITARQGTPVRGALVFVRATPRVVQGQTRKTGADGWVTLRLVPNQHFPQPRDGFNVQFFVKAYRAGDPRLGGIAGYRLVQVRLADT